MIKSSLCERGSAFGYNNLVVDMFGFDSMKKCTGSRVLMLTHNLQQPGQVQTVQAVAGEQITTLARAGMATRIGVILEAHQILMLPNAMVLVQLLQLSHRRVFSPVKTAWYVSQRVWGC